MFAKNTGRSFYWNMKKHLLKFICILSLLMAASALQAQGIAPVISEYGRGKANGAFTIMNDSLEPLSVVVHEYSFDVNSDSKSMIRTLDPSIHIEIDSMSAKIGAKQKHEFAYKVKCDTLPCWGTFNASISGAHTLNGLAMIMVIPHTFYVCQDKQKGCRDRVRRNIFHLEN
jgi:hypothetical protein